MGADDRDWQGVPVFIPFRVRVVPCRFDAYGDHPAHHGSDCWCGVRYARHGRGGVCGGGQWWLRWNSTRQFAVLQPFARFVDIGGFQFLELRASRYGPRHFRLVWPNYGRRQSRQWPFPRFRAHVRGPRFARVFSARRGVGASPEQVQRHYQRPWSGAWRMGRQRRVVRYGPWRDARQRSACGWHGHRRGSWRAGIVFVRRREENTSFRLHQCCRRQSVWLGLGSPHDARGMD